MANVQPPPYTPCRRYFDLPDVLASDRWNHLQQLVKSPVLVMPLFKTTPEERAAIIVQLEGTVESPSRSLALIPWLRATTPVLEEVIFDIVHNTHGGFVSDAPFVFLDMQGLAEGICVISHYVRIVEDGANHVDGGFDPEFAIVPMGKARQILESGRKEKSWFPDVLDEGLRVQISENKVDEGQKKVEEGLEEGTQWKWPEQLPADLKLQKEAPILISLIHLSLNEIAALTAEVGDEEGVEPVSILDWPVNIQPGSRADLWHIFDRIKPSWSAISPYGELFGLFIDSDYLDGPHRSPHILLATRRRLVDSERTGAGYPSAFKIENSIQPSIVTTSSVRQIWAGMWSPTGTANRDGVRENETMRRLTQYPHARELQEVVTAPDVPIVSGPLPIFVLIAITPTQERQLRALISTECYPWQFISVPGGEGTIERLMRYFQSPQYLRSNENPPSDFLAIDALTLSTLDSGGSLSWLLGTSMTVWHELDDGTQLAKDEVGYVVGRSVMYEFDDYQTWSVQCAEAEGLMASMDAPQDAPGAGKYYWECFDVDDEELRELVSTRG